MSKFRLTIWSLLVLVLFLAVALAALKNSSESVASAVFSLAVLCLCVAPLVAVASVGRRRLASLAFTLFGSAYLGLTCFGQVIPTPRFAPSGWVATALEQLEPLMEADQPAGSANGITVPASRTNLVINLKLPPQFRPFEKAQEFRQIGHSLAALFIGLVAALVVLVVIKSDDNDASGRP